MPHLTVNGANLYYEQAGQGERTLVLIHGNVGSARWWDHMFTPLAERYKVVRIDLRGCGQSEPAGGNSIPQYAADVQAMLQELGLNRVTLVGHSMGGAISMAVAINAPELVEAMVLVNSAPAEGITTPDERKPLLEMMIKDRNFMKMALAAVVPTAATGEFFEALVDDAMIAGPTTVPNYTSLGEQDFRPALASCQIPTLIVYGVQDTLISLEMMERTRDSIPESTLLLYEGMGHSPNVEAPARLMQDLEAFLREKVGV
ncbi:alpha/beta fold hydrolase [Tumebacillus permanentifrigoris]|uniref:Pimeloyl-ACP methyl ester carboxylesterase n=1 Tax=Tumebacillus permanentifrigoris TaxID=378543 RepID=A0A316DCK1_9BACL|nr:alpha/beta hydrolase [Tumebacillus permanentifrigoris]PWK15704.1 pimeloyl-ACP methyl ester carboxylesterase [Tumebacillus permanentifrigoris]